MKTTQATKDPNASWPPSVDRPSTAQTNGATIENAPVEDSTLVNRTKPSNKGKGKAPPGKDPPAQPMQINITPASYAQAALTAADTRQPPAPKANVKLPGITEVTVLRTGGHADPHVERCV